MSLFVDLRNTGINDVIRSYKKTKSESGNVIFYPQINPFSLVYFIW